MRAYPTKNILTTMWFLRGVLGRCKGEPMFVVDRAPRASRAPGRMGLKHTHHTFGERSLVESVFSSSKQRTKLFFNAVTVNPGGNPDSKRKRGVWLWNLFCKMFTCYYN